MTFRPPIIVTIKPQPAAQAEYIVNLSVLFSPNPAMPFRQSDWTQISKIITAKVDDFINLVPLYSVVVVAAPFRQSDWLTTQPRPKVTDTSVAPSSSLYFPNPAQPFLQSEWRLTAKIPFSLKSDSYWGGSPLYQPNPAQPFNQKLWEAAAKAWPKIVDTSIEPSLSLYFPNPAVFVTEFDWTRIPPTTKAIVDDFVNLLPLRAIVVVAAPFYQNDWTIIVTPRPTVTDTSFVAPSPLYHPNPSRPFIQGDWFTIPLPRQKINETSLSALPSLYYPNPVQPFAQNDWVAATLGFKPAQVDTVELFLPLNAPPPITSPTPLGQPFINTHVGFMWTR